MEFIESPYRISIALVTRNRPKSLKRTLESLRQQDIQPFEVIISDDSDEDKASKVQRFAEMFHCRYARGPRRGLYANRNNAVKHVQGTHVRTMDDDHEFPVGHFADCEKAVIQKPNAVWIIGERNPGDKPLATGDYTCPGQLHPRGYSYTPTSMNDMWAFADGASIIPVWIFQSGVNYVENYRFGSAYLEFGSRLRWHGIPIKLLNSSIIHHHDPNDRSFPVTNELISSRLFAMLCHCFIYQPTYLNKILFSLQVGQLVISKPTINAQALKVALRDFRGHKARLFTMPRYLFDPHCCKLVCKSSNGQEITGEQSYDEVNFHC